MIACDLVYLSTGRLFGRVLKLGFGCFSRAGSLELAGAEARAPGLSLWDCLETQGRPAVSSPVCDLVNVQEFADVLSWK